MGVGTSRQKKNCTNIGAQNECGLNNFQGCAYVVEVKHYSDVYFDCITAFEVLWHRTFVKGRVHTCKHVHDMVTWCM